MKKRHLVIAAAAAIALGTAGSAWAAAFPTDWGSKNVMVKRPLFVQSVYYNGEDFNGKPVTGCINLPAANTSTVWNSTQELAPDGSSLELITYTNRDCFTEARAKWFVVPNNNSLINFWADMTS